jgi:hypothetical protein
MASDISAAVPTSTRRLLLGTNMRPSMYAPASAAACASATLRTPQILTSAVRGCGRGGADQPRSVRMNTAVSGARMRLSPTRTARMPCAVYCATSAGEPMPESAQRTTPRPATMSASRLVVPMSTVDSCRLRLLTPTSFAPRSSAAPISATLLTSTSGFKFMPNAVL